MVNGSLLELLASSGTLFFLDKPEFLQNEPKPSRPNWSRREIDFDLGEDTYYPMLAL